MYISNNNYCIDNSEWSVGCNIGSAKILCSLLELLKNNKFEFKNLKNIFVGPPCRLASGRFIKQDSLSLDDIFSVYESIHSLGIGIRVPLQKFFIKDDDFDDILVNEILKRINDLSSESTKNGIIVSSDRLESYIRKFYPKLEIISSLIRPAMEVGLDKDNAEYYNNLLEKYDVVVVNASRVFEKDFLNKITSVERIEVITNSDCVKNCKLAKYHYTEIEKTIELFSKNIKHETINYQNSCSMIKNSTLRMRTEDVDILMKNGVRKFKLEGRERNFSSIFKDIVYYLSDKEELSKIIDLDSIF